MKVGDLVQLIDRQHAALDRLTKAVELVTGDPARLMALALQQSRPADGETLQ